MTQEAMAQAACDALINTPATAEDFLEACAGLNLPCKVLQIGESIDGESFIVVFSDGSATFADTIDSSFQLWIADNAHKDHDLLQVPPELLTSLNISKTTYEHEISTEAFSSIDEEEAFDAWLKDVALEHPDPPEAVRRLLVDPECDFTWGDAETGADAQKAIVLLALHIHPGAKTVEIKSSHDGGRTHVQKRQDAAYKGMMARMSHNDTRSTKAYFDAEAHAEYVDFDVDFESMHVFSEALAEVSCLVLATLGRPVGWETDYNDGAYSRLSGYSAHAVRITCDAGSASNHERLSGAEWLVKTLRDAEILDAVNDALITHKIAPLTA